MCSVVSGVLITPGCYDFHHINSRAGRISWRWSALVEGNTHHFHIDLWDCIRRSAIHCQSQTYDIYTQISLYVFACFALFVWRFGAWNAAVSPIYSYARRRSGSKSKGGEISARSMSGVVDGGESLGIPVEGSPSGGVSWIPGEPCFDQMPLPFFSVIRLFTTHSHQLEPSTVYITSSLRYQSVWTKHVIVIHSLHNDVDLSMKPLFCVKRSNLKNDPAYVHSFCCVVTGPISTFSPSNRVRVLPWAKITYGLRMADFFISTLHAAIN